MNGKLRHFNVQFNLFDINVRIYFGTGIFVDINDGNAHHEAVRVALFFYLGVVHVKFDHDVLDFDFDIKKDFFKGFFEKVHWIVFTEFLSGQSLVDIKEWIFLHFFHAFLEVFVEIFVGFELNENLIGLNLNTFGDNFGKIGQLYFKVADAARMHHVRTGDQMFQIDIVDVKANGSEVQTAVFKVFESNFVIDELVEELIESVLDESPYGVKAGNFLGDIGKNARKHSFDN